jgi:hypothetical protein
MQNEKNIKMKYFHTKPHIVKGKIKGFIHTFDGVMIETDIANLINDYIGCDYDKAKNLMQSINK